MRTLTFLTLTASAIFCLSCSNPTSKNNKSEIDLGPTMGWSSWNTYAVNISDTLIMAQADAMVQTGLAEVGYNHINIDDGYFGGRDSGGNLLFHPTRFPGGMQAVVDHIHSLGLKAGIYSDAGQNTCGNMYNKDSIARGVGLYGHDQQDADLFFKKIGFDFIKVDFCGGNGAQNTDNLVLDPKERYMAIRKAIDNTGRKDVRLNVCRWDYPGNWVSEAGFSWRISHDIASNWWFVSDIIQQNLYLSAYAHDGHYNDMDMLEVGRTLSLEEDKTHFGLWCIMSSPLLIGCDMTTIKPETLTLLMNKELIALNQDPLHLQAHVVKHTAEEGTYVLVKDILTLNGTTRAVALYNPTQQEKTISIDYKDLYLEGNVTVRDLFAHEDITTNDTSLEIAVPSHGTRIYTVKADRRLERTLYEAETAYLSDYQELYNNNVLHTATYQQMEGASGEMVASNLGYSPTNDIIFKDVYSQEGGQYKVTLRCFDCINTAVSDSPFRRNTIPGKELYVSVNEIPLNTLRTSGEAFMEDITFTIDLKKGQNSISIRNDRGPIPDIDYMSVERL